MAKTLNFGNNTNKTDITVNGNLTEKGKIILDSNSYGETLPEGNMNGQIYFQITNDEEYLNKNIGTSYAGCFLVVDENGKVNPKNISVWQGGEF